MFIFKPNIIPIHTKLRQIWEENRIDFKLYYWE